MVLLDVILPGWNGFEVCRQLKNLYQTKDLQIILITCLSDLDSKVRVKVLINKKRCLDRLRNDCERAVNSASFDGLTGLNNQTYFKKFLDLEVIRSERQKYPVSPMIIDVDDFKKINDHLGHLTGDLILRELAQLIKNNVREIDLSARYGGDEFVVVLPYTDQAKADHIVQRLQDALVQWGAIEGNPLGRVKKEFTDTVSVIVKISRKSLRSLERSCSLLKFPEAPDFCRPLGGEAEEKTGSCVADIMRSPRLISRARPGARSGSASRRNHGYCFLGNHDMKRP